MISLILGLGNIGGEYEKTRHNIGFEVLDDVARSLKAVSMPEKAEYRWAVSRVAGRQLYLAWPTTFMNRSGLAAQALLQDLDLEPTEMLVVLDDFNLPLGRIRFRKSGSDGGHNGLTSLVETLETEDFPRLRLGIGPLAEDADVVDFVLGRFAEDEIEPARNMVGTAAEAVLFAIDHRLEEAMSKYNANPA